METVSWKFDELLGVLRILDTDTKEITRLYADIKKKKDHQSPITGIRWKPKITSEDGERELLCTSSVGGIYCWKPLSKEVVYSFQEEEKNEIYTLCYSHCDSQFATAGHDHKIRIYDDETQNLIHTFHGAGDDEKGH